MNQEKCHLAKEKKERLKSLLTNMTVQRKTIVGKENNQVDYN